MRPAEGVELEVSSPLVTSTSASVEAESDVRAPQPVEGPARADRPRLAIILFTALALASATWITAVVISAGRGLDVSDEGFYLLSYRWWSTNLHTFTGVQFLYGPVYELLGWDIAGLRLFRLLTVVLTHVAFGWTFMRWLRLRRPHAPATPVWELSGTAAILACGALAYGWLPRSPGYNDVTLLTAMLAMALVLVLARGVETGARVRAWAPVALGVLTVVSMLAKWASSVLTFGLIGLVAVAVLWRSGWRAILRLLGWTVAGMLACAALIHVLIIPLDVALPEMAAVTKLVAAGANDPTSLLAMYARTGAKALLTVGKAHYLLLLAVVLALVSRRRAVQIAAAVIGLAGSAMSIRYVILTKGHFGGPAHLSKYANTLIALVCLGLLAAAALLVRDRLRRRDQSSLSRSDRRTWLLFATLLLLPIVQAMGTGNAIYLMAVNGFAVWMAAIIFVLTGMDQAPRVARALTAAVAAGTVLVSVHIGSTGILRFPYRTAGYSASTETVAGVDALASITLERERADGYSKLYGLLKPYVEPSGRAVMAFDEKAGLVLMLGGQSVGEAWYSFHARERTAAGIVAACAGGTAWPGGRPPVLLFSRPVVPTEIGALRSCGLSFENDFRLLAPKEETMGISVYVPINEGVGSPS